MREYQDSKAVILAIDDEAQVLGEVAQALTNTGYGFHCCSTAQAARQLAHELRPELIISDINLGADNGLELIAEIKRDADLSDVPVIFLSGAQIPNIIQRAHAAGGTYYLRKPFDPEVLVELVEKALWMPHLVASHVGR